MKTRTAIAITLALLTAAIATAAQACPLQDHLNLGLRAAYGLPMGNAWGEKTGVTEETEFSELTSGSVPVQLDLNYRFNPSWQAGAYFAYGTAMVADEAKDALEATGLTDIGGHREQRIGLQASYHILPQAKLAPWVGLGAGYGWTRYAAAKTAAGKETEIGLSGFEGSLQIGGDYQATPKFTVGPFASVTVGQFDKSLTWVEDADESSNDIDEKGIHEWVQVGIKAGFNF